MRNNVKSRYEIKERRWLKYVITVVVLSGFTALFAWVYGAFKATNERKLLIALCNAFSLPGFLAVLLGLSLVVKYSDIMGFFIRCFNGLVQLFKQDAIDFKYRNFHNHKKLLKEKRDTFLFVFAVGFVFFAIGAAIYAYCLLA